MNPNQSFIIPRISHQPHYTRTDGHHAAFLSASYGLTLDPWQQYVADAWLATNQHGKSLAGKVGLAVPRQNGKNAILEAVELFKMVVQGRRVLHTAHEVKTARKAFLRLASFFENAGQYPELAEMVVQLRYGNGQEGILLNNGGSCEFLARSRGSGRGFTADDLVMDEAQELTDEHLEALLPTISSAPKEDPQQLYTGTPPGPTSPGEVFRRLRDTGVAGADRRLVWHEWSIPDDANPDEAVTRWKQLAQETNPALNIRLNLQTVRDEVGVMSAAGFCRERLGKWDEKATAAAAIDYPLWRRLQIEPEEAPTRGRVAYAVRFSVDGQVAALAAARDPGGDEPVHVEGIQVFEMVMGIGPIVDFLAPRARAAAHIVIDGKSGADLLIQALRDRGIRNKRLIMKMTPDLVTAACATFQQSLTDASLTHIGQEPLDYEVQNATVRKIGAYGGFGWGAPKGENVALLEAATYAAHAVRHTKRKRKEGANAGEPAR